MHNGGNAMAKPKSKMKVAVVLVAILAVTLSAILGWRLLTPSKTVLKVFHAGSLTVPFEEIERLFEARHPEVDVQRESMGSVKAVRQITEIGKRVDVIAVADYSLIPSLMYPKYADWYVKFATNELVLAYNPTESRYADEININNWYDILRRDGVTFGFSNPNLDPCGYRALMAIQLAELYYNDSAIFDDLILANTAITVGEEENGTYTIKVPEDLAPNTEKVTVRAKSVELIALVEGGGLDYAFEYKSVAVQHNLSFVSLPDEVDLGSVDYAPLYRRVRVMRADGRVCVGKPITYGVTVPKNSPNPKLGLEFVKFIIGEGMSVLEACGQLPIQPPVGSGNLPPELRSLVRLETVVIQPLKGHMIRNR